MSRIFKNYPNKITNKYGNGHTGIDLVAKVNDKGASGFDYVVAHSEGTVVSVVKNYKTADKTGNSYGNYVKIRHNNGYYTLSAHLKYGSVNVSVGQHVSQGQVIGYMGNTGRTNGAHVHFEVRNTSDKCIDPTPYIDADLPNASSKITCEYRTYDNQQKEYLPIVTDGQYAGNYGHTVGGIQAITKGGGITWLTASVIGKGWLEEVKDGAFNSGSNNYAGIKGQNIDRIMFKSEKGKYRYRVKLLNGNWLSWVTGYNKNDANNGYAGIKGQAIEGIEIEFLD